MQKFVLVQSIFCLVLVLVAGCNENSNHRYGTWDSLEPDTWATSWLIKKHIDTNAKIIVRPNGTALKDTVSFSTPYAKIKRGQKISAFNNALKHYNVKNDLLWDFAQILNELETLNWQKPTSSLTLSFQENYRELQNRYKHSVSISCYNKFFDNAFNQLSNNQKIVVFEPYIPQDCDNGAHPTSEQPLVYEYHIPAILDAINTDKNVVFIDTREPFEFDEYHIPGAANIPLRKIDEVTVERVKDADIVISYCIKDFRGYEVARKLSELGVKNSGIMSPYGLSGWKSLGLPVSTKETESKGVQQLIACAGEFPNCRY